MTDEEINRKFDVVAQHLANLAVSQAVSEEKANERFGLIQRQIEHLGRALVELTNAHTETQRTTAGLQQTTAELQVTTAELQRAMARLAESQTRSDRRLDALIDIVRRDHEGRGRREGEDGTA